MEVAIRTRNLEVTELTKALVEEKVQRLAKYLENMDRAEVHLQEETKRHITDRHVCEITMHGHGHVVRAKSRSDEMLTSVDQVVQKLEHQLERLKGKLVARRHPKKSQGKSHPLANSDAAAVIEMDGDRQVIVKAKKFAVSPISPEEAVTRMEMVGHDFYFFTNSDTGMAAVVYRREDGDVGLIDAVV